MADEAYVSTVQDIINKGLISKVLSIAYEFDIFSFLADAGSPKTAQEIADARDLKERYVQEAMNCLGCANIVDISKNSSGQVTYSMTSAQGAVFKGPETMLIGFLASGCTRFTDMLEVFRKDGPEGLPYSNDQWIAKGLDHMMGTRVDMQVELVLEKVEGIREKLKSGIRVIEFGSGLGGFIAGFAEKFPNSLFVASEYTVDATRKLKERRGHLANMEIRQLDLLNPPDDLLDSFDLALVNDVIHDLPNPQGGLKSYHKILKPGGYFAFVDIDGHSDVTVNKANSPGAGVLYSTSTFICVPGACQGPGSISLGALWGRDTALQMLQEAGLKNVSVYPHLGAFVLYVCQK